MDRMKKNLWMLLTAALLVIGLVFSACAETAETAEAPAPADDPVLATFNGEEIPLSMVESVLYTLYSNNYVSSLTDYEAGLQAIINDMLFQKKIKELGLDQFTDEETAALAADAASEWKAAVASYVSYYLTEDTEEARAQLEKDGDAYFRSLGYSEEQLLESLKGSASYDRLMDYMLEGKDVSVSQDEIRQEFEYYAAKHQEMYEGNVYLYEAYKYYMGATSWYIPDGYRGVTHILLNVDEALLTAYQDAQAAYEESVTEETPDGSEELKLVRDAAKAAVLASRQDAIDDIYARLAKGEEFANLIKEYGEDGGMTDEARLLTGYEVHRESFTYDPAFVEGAFSEKMLKPGDTSDPVVGSYGIHIIHYLRDVPGGFVEMTDEISAEIEESLVSEKKSLVYDETVDQWKAECEIVYNQEAIDALNAAGGTEPTQAE